MRESKIEAYVVAWAKAHAILAIKFTPMGEAGWPDRIFLYQGLCVFIEFKAPGKLERPLQSHRLEQLRSSGFIAEVCDGESKAIELLRKEFRIPQ